MGLIKFLLISIAVLWLLRVLARLLLPFLFQQVVKKAQQQSQPFQKQNRKPDGTIQVDYIPPQQKESPPSSKSGDFIDYEEVK